MEGVFPTVLDPSSVQIVYRMRSISKSGAGPRPNLTLLRSTWFRGGVSLRFGAQCWSTYYITENATAGGQQIHDRKTEADIGHFLDMNDSSFCGIVKYYPNLLPMIVLSALLCKKTVTRKW